MAFTGQGRLHAKPRSPCVSVVAPESISYVFVDRPYQLASYKTTP